MQGAPARINRVVHTNARIAFKPLAALVPDIQHRRTDGKEGDVMALAFQDSDGDVHVFVIDDERLEQLKSDLVGGVVIPAPSEIVVPH